MAHHHSNPNIISLEPGLYLSAFNSFACSPLPSHRPVLLEDIISMAPNSSQSFEPRSESMSSASSSRSSECENLALSWRSSTSCWTGTSPATSVGGGYVSDAGTDVSKGYLRNGLVESSGEEEMAPPASISAIVSQTSITPMHTLSPTEPALSRPFATLSSYSISKRYLAWQEELTELLDWRSLALTRKTKHANSLLSTLHPTCNFPNSSHACRSCADAILFVSEQRSVVEMEEAQVGRWWWGCLKVWKSALEEAFEQEKRVVGMGEGVREEAKETVEGLMEAILAGHSEWTIFEGFWDGPERAQLYQRPACIRNKTAALAA